MGLKNSILNWLEDIGSHDYIVRSLDFSKSFEQKYGNLKLIGIQYYTLFEAQYLVNRLIEGLLEGKKIDRTLIHKEFQDQTEIYLTEFLTDRYRGVDDYTDDIYLFVNSVIELDLILVSINEDQRWAGQLGFNYSLATMCLPDLYKITDQLNTFNLRMNI